MALIADILLIAGAIGAAFYCMILSRRLSRFNDLEKGVGGAVAVLSAQVDDMTKTLDAARKTAQQTSSSLKQLTERAEDVAKRLELLMAAMHDLPDTISEPAASAEQAKPAVAARPKPPLQPTQQVQTAVPDPQLCTSQPEPTVAEPVPTVDGPSASDLEPDAHQPLFKRATPAVAASEADEPEPLVLTEGDMLKEMVFLRHRKPMEEVH